MGRIWMCVAAALLVSGMSCRVATSTGPGVTLSGRIVSNPGGEGIAGATVSLAGQSVVTNGDGTFTLPDVGSDTSARVFIRAPGYLDRWTNLNVDGRAGLVLDLIADAPPFSLPQFREVARDSFEHPDKLSALRMWSRAPRFLIRTVHDDSGAPISRDVIDEARQVIAQSVPDLTGGRYLADRIDERTDVPGDPSSTRGLVVVRFVSQVPQGDRFVGQATVGEGNPGTIWIQHVAGARDLHAPCALPVNILHHEIVHTMGFFHTHTVTESWSPFRVFTTSCTGFRYDAAKLLTGVAYSRRAGNRDVDVDSLFVAPLSVGGDRTIACAIAEPGSHLILPSSASAPSPAAPGTSQPAPLRGR